MVRVMPFTPRTLADIDAADDGSALIKQIFYLLFLGAIGLLAYRQAWRFARALPISFLLLMLYTLASLGWSSVPLVALPRWGSTFIVALTILFACARLRPRTVLDIVRWVSLALTLASLLSRL